MTSETSKYVGVHRRLSSVACRLNAKVLLFFGIFYTGMDRSGRTNAAKIECTHRRASKLLTSHSIWDQFPFLKAVETKTHNYHKYFKGNLSSRLPTNRHNIEVHSSLRLSAILLLLLINYHLKALPFMFSHLFLLLSNLIQEGKPTLLTRTMQWILTQ